LTTRRGPCVETIRTGQAVIVDDFTVEDRWPAFAAKALGVGLKSMITVPLRLEGPTFGSMNLYSWSAAAFNLEARRVASLFASGAATGLSNASYIHHLRKALKTREVIGQAKGVLIAELGVTEDGAFDMLKKHLRTRT
jgi:GAF domain-containing protein